MSNKEIPMLPDSRRVLTLHQSSGPSPAPIGETSSATKRSASVRNTTNTETIPRAPLYPAAPSRQERKKKTTVQHTTEPPALEFTDAQYSSSLRRDAMLYRELLTCSRPSRSREDSNLKFRSNRVNMLGYPGGTFPPPQRTRHAGRNTGD